MIQHPRLAALTRFGVRLGLQHMRALMRHLGQPQLRYPTLHVAGTNGKGSVVRTLGAMLRAQGLRVGEYVSPHLQRVNERIWVDGEEISDADLSALLEELAVEREAWAATGLTEGLSAEAELTYFEMMTAAAFVHFARVGVDVAVIEVGLGGRLDATNLLDPVVCGITSIGFDHMEQLGHDLPSIAAEKAGIIQPGRPVVVGPLPAAALRTIRTIAADRGAPLLAPDSDYRVDLDPDGGLRYTGVEWQLGGLRLALDGEHQRGNAGVALAMAERLPPHLRPGADAVRAGLAAVRHAGRLEWLAADVLADCAHNQEGAAQLAACLRALPEDRRPRTLLLGMSADKDARAIVVALAPLFDRIYTTHCSHPRAASAGELAEQLMDVGVPVLPAGAVEVALPRVRAEGPCVVAGSIFLVGAARDLLGLP